MDRGAQLREAMLVDLDLQWRDHFHMRDQTWKTLTNSVLFFLGVVGLEIKGNLSDFVMVPGYLLVLLTALLGWVVAAHHRLRQGQKFDLIALYEKELGLFTLKRDIIERCGEDTSWASKLFTSSFIRFMHLCVATVAVALLARRLFFLS